MTKNLLDNVEYEKLFLTLYVYQIPTLNIDPTAKRFKQTIAKPFSHCPLEVWNRN